MTSHPRAGHQGDPSQMPVDLGAVQFDDVLIDQMADGAPVPDTCLTRVLVPWRREIHAAGIPELIDTDTALAALRASQAGVSLRPGRTWRDMVAAGIALLFIVGAGLGLASVNADPGDWLYPLRELLYPR